VNVGENTVEIKTEADNNDIIEYPHNDKRRTGTGMFGVFVMLYSLHLYH